jgi:predicted secreted protein
MRRTLLALICLAPTCLTPVAAAAQPDPARTTLLLSETVELAVRQDELYAELAVEVRAASAAAAQAAVNRAMAAALDRARATPGVTTATGSYSVWRAQGSGIPAAQAWRAGQTVQLTAQDAAPLLELVGTLQDQGLAVRQLGFRVSRELHRRTREAATEEAVRAITGRAQRMADLLGLAFDRFASVDLDGGRERPQPFMAMAASPARASADSAPPVAEPAEVRVAATISAQAVLRPR